MSRLFSSSPAAPWVPRFPRLCLPRRRVFGHDDDEGGDSDDGEVDDEGELRIWTVTDERGHNHASGVYGALH